MSGFFSCRYVVFRETAMCFPIDGTPVVLVVGFRLLAIRSNKVFHWLFRRLCILSTPAWSGLYAWRGEEQSRAYIGGPELDRFLATQTAMGKMTISY
jgi:hypothetical protein